MHTITLNGERFNLPLPVEVGKTEVVFHLGLDDSLHRFPTARDYIVAGSLFDVSASVLSLFNIFVDCDHA